VFCNVNIIVSNNWILQFGCSLRTLCHQKVDGFARYLDIGIWYFKERWVKIRNFRQGCIAFADSPYPEGFKA
jgi:hypothetical protein